VDGLAQVLEVGVGRLSELVPFNDLAAVLVDRGRDHRLVPGQTQFHKRLLVDRVGELEALVVVAVGDVPAVGARAAGPA
jgi:hypothetical protein